MNGQNKQLNIEKGIIFNEISTFFSILWVLSESVASRIRDIHMYGNVISIHYRTNEFNGLTRQRKIKRYINTASEIVETAIKII